MFAWAVIFCVTITQLANAGSSIDISWSDCTPSSAKGKLSSLTFDPPSPEKTNANFSAIANGTVSETVNNGTFEAKVTFLGIVLDDIKGSLCSPDTVPIPDNYGTIWYLGIKCPQIAGDFSFELKAYLSSSAPDEKVKMVMTTFDDNKDVIVCAELTLDIKKSEEESEEKKK
mmetsp:Transcript_59843/g.98792  ORF Transcript_59843/g.98792 Transcript_59843/m.98792 type:complete len:172 (+) Transcript_59843:38-553(+)